MCGYFHEMAIFLFQGPCLLIAEFQASRNITMSIFWVCVVYAFGSALYSLQNILSFCIAKNVLRSSFYHYFELVTFWLLCLSHSINLFIYIKYNNIFRTVFRRKFLCFRNDLVFHNKVNTTNISN